MIRVCSGGNEKVINATQLNYGVSLREYRVEERVDNWKQKMIRYKTGKLTKKEKDKINLLRSLTT